MSSEVQEKKVSQQEKPIITGVQQMTIKGALIGATITAFISWNSGRYSKIGQAIKRFRFIRNFINYKKLKCLPILTNYNQPQLNTVANNFFCYSGQPGIGKSYHFRNLASRQSLNRPILYLSFKTVGRDNNFQSDVSSQLSFGEDSTAMISQIIRAVNRIHLLNTKPQNLWIKYSITHIAFIVSQIFTFFSNLDATIGILTLIGLGLTHFSYTYFVHPFIIQSLRKTTPLIILDDMNKIQHLNMLSQIVRFLKLIEQNSSNVMLVSSDQETWSKLRREPGMKDRLRLRQLKYDHQQTCRRFIDIVNKDYEGTMKFVSGHKIYDSQIIIALIKELIGVRQVTLRRFMGILKLNDEQQYQKLVSLIREKKDKSLAYVTSQFTKIIFQTQMETMVSNLKTIKRELSLMSWEEFIKSLNILLRKYKLPSDDKVGPYLKAYNIVRDLRSEYVINGRFNYIIYQMAVEEYLKDLKEFQQIEKKN